MDYEAIGFWIQVVIICALTIILAVLVFGMAVDSLRTKKGKRTLRTMKDVCSTILACVSPSTPLQKEIREEEHTIKKLEAHRADMKRLAELRRKRESLFEEVDDKDAKRVIAFVDGIQLPHAFANERKAIEHVEKYYPKAYEIEWKEVF